MYLPNLLTRSASLMLRHPPNSNDCSPTMLPHMRSTASAPTPGTHEMLIATRWLQYCATLSKAASVSRVQP
eukprot:scaffold117623_cov75-Phaeocystis_antarctica.AAC.6